MGHGPVCIHHMFFFPFLYSLTSTATNLISYHLLFSFRAFSPSRCVFVFASSMLQSGQNFCHLQKKRSFHCFIYILTRAPLRLWLCSFFSYFVIFSSLLFSSLLFSSLLFSSLLFYSDCCECVWTSLNQSHDDYSRSHSLISIYSLSWK